MSGSCCDLLTGAFFDVVNDAGGRKQTEDGCLTLGAGLRLRALEGDDVFGFCRSDGAIDFFGEEFGVAVVGDHTARWSRDFR